MSLEFDLRGIDSTELGRLLEALAETDVEECEIEQGEFRVSVKRRVRVAPAPDAGTPKPPREEVRPQDEGMVVQAQAVGTFFRAEKRSEPAKVEVGARVETGYVLGWIEVLNIPHAVHATHDGIVESFLVEEGQPVEYGQALVSLQPPPQQGGESRGA